MTEPNEPPHILVVDDDRFNAKALTRLLESDYRVSSVSGGEQALESVRNESSPDLILLDIMMPGIGGYEVCRLLKDDERTRDIPVIFITAMEDVSDETRGLEMGAVDYIVKPFSPPIVWARVKTQLSLKRSLEIQKNQNRELMELNEVKNRFLGIAAHDLRNPLISIRGLSELMIKMDLSTEKRSVFLGTINQVSNQMLRLVNDLLDISVIESGRFDLHLKQADLSQLAAERAGLVEEIAREKGIVLVTELPEVASLPMDSDRIGQVIDNLLTNAIKFSNAGTTIRLVTRTVVSGVEVAMEDQGPGIPKEDLGKLFGTFQKLSVQPTGGEKSTGLGLSIVKKIVEAHQGEIRVASKVGSGSTFTVSLPTA